MNLYGKHECPPGSLVGHAEYGRGVVLWEALDLRFVQFVETGKYTSTSFDEVENRVYGNDTIMTYHMHGLVLGQFLWFEQYERFKFFKENL